MLNGSKIWSSGAFRADYALCLARTNWHVPKHRGLTMFIVKIHQPGIEVQQIKMVERVERVLPGVLRRRGRAGWTNVVGEVDDGWTVATRLLVHERNAVGGASPYTSGLGRRPSGRGIGRDLARAGQGLGLADDPRVRQLVAEARVNDRVAQPAHRAGDHGHRQRPLPGAGRLAAPALRRPPTASAATTSASRSPGAGRRAWTDGRPGRRRRPSSFLIRQGGSLGGGSNEMQRNIISERVLGMPREYAADKDKPFDEVLHNAVPLPAGGCGWLRVGPWHRSSRPPSPPTPSARPWSWGARPPPTPSWTRPSAGAPRASWPTGVRPGWRIPLVDDASLLSAATLLAAARVGAAAALMNPRLTGGELTELRRAAGAAPLGVAGAGYHEALDGAGGATVLGADELLSAAPVDAAPADPDPDADAVVLFTSGTTGTPKAVPLTHGLIGPRVAAFSPTVDPVPLVSLMCVPLVHIGGMLGLLVALARGGTVVVQTRFEAGEWLSLAEAHRVNSSFVVPTMLHRILDHPEFDRTDLGSLVGPLLRRRAGLPDLIRRAMDRLPGVALMNTFGQTETLGSITALQPGDHTPERLASVGRPLPGVEVRVVDAATGRPVPLGTVGELWVRTEASVIPSAQAADPSVPDGWLRTGDMVREDADGYLYPAGRLADTINRGGEKFSPAEVEAVVAAAPRGAPTWRWWGCPTPRWGAGWGWPWWRPRPVGHRRAARVLPGPDRHFKLPERLLVVDEIPYNDFGKVDRKGLRPALRRGPGR